ncbi:Uncharacterised protein [Mycolicibacterium phlei]|uniref:Uncharacterized protein n=1 Tax=Mycolicibacterium phlei DSM 43239 = CCUG 21000 TaxID=1226750 RepID=A0A5N5US81_MYCPH|nr:hypothetical protein MPHLCCUG_03653 [Mycolicibacterium phlei]KAB7751000.1 hypothetical protein MPHL21000_25595 [Mycolicibacterium phlei DSM 43239 = CCUG 21000]KXW71270.1 hypothetical protein MPHL43072_16880 [Mycolicibacterium phlei DSM 43072]KXW73597.1 hypothetical protein MPHL43070_11715 [Mycolicibacterium phlei DSM 43070]VEG10552.1 Uncharacterised protein [Mycobacteroides chelonae]
MTASRGILAAVSTATVLAGVLAAPAQAAPPSYGSNGVFNVSTNLRPGWTTAVIEPGRYRVDQAPSMPPYQSAQGFWYRCSDFPCTPGHPGNVIASGPADRNAPTFVDILPTDVAVALHNVTLTVAG